MRLVVVVLMAASLFSCRDHGGGGGGSVASPVPPAAAPSGGSYLIVPSEAVAYRRGREREIGLLREALARHTSVPQATSIQAGAAAAGLSVDAYQLLVARVDSGLRLRSATDSIEPGRAEWAELDSLRVELTVLRTQLDARGSGTP